MMERNPAVLLVSADRPLIEAMQGVVGSIGNLDLVVLRCADEVRPGLPGEDVALVLVHLECVGDVDAVIRLLRVIGEARRSLPMLVISNHYRAEQALALLRSGVADYLSRPLDLGRLTYLIDALTVRARLV